MNNLFVHLLLGHLLGDFVFQNKWMAVNKSASHVKSLVHVSIYTLCILLMTQWNWLWAAIVFVPHFLIDRYSLADKWLLLINGRALVDFIKNGHKNIPMSDPNERNNYYTLRAGFSSVVYTVTDNTFHFFCLWYGYQLFINLIKN